MNQYRSTSIIFIILYSSFINFSVSSYQSERLKCLQSELGNEPDMTEQWIEGKVSVSSSSTSWIYNNERCPFLQFNESAFCKRSVGCGNTILFVGDSTVRHWILSSDLLFNKKAVEKSCPINKCRITDKECVNGREFPMEYSTICNQYCPVNTQTKMIYIRHDFLINKHGLQWLPTSVCDHWFNEAKAADIIVLSTGPHSPAMIKYPYHHHKPPPKFSVKELFHNESQHLATTLSNIVKSSAVIVYRTGPMGTPNPSHDCDLKPLRHPPKVASNYSWDVIPEMNRIYIESLNHTLSKQLLVMNTQYMMLEWVGCRRDGLHFDYHNPKTPMMLEWQLLHNLLMEYKNIQ
jgi:hypothetical protein